MRAAFFLILAAGSAHAQPTAQQVLASVQQFYAKTPQLTADFDQVFTSQTFGSKKASAGKLWAMKPMSFRVDFDASGTTNVATSFISDGKTLWMVSRTNKTISVMPVQQSSLPGAIAFLTGGASLSTSYTAALDPAGRLELTPKQASTVAKLVFVVAPDGSVSETIVTNSSGDVEDRTFKNVSYTTPMQASWFQVNPSAMPSFKVISAPAPPAPAAAPAPPAPHP